jgi:ankyrin repeat protein
VYRFTDVITIFEILIFPTLSDTHVKELPTLLHCAAKFGLKNLAIHLLQCSGATWASKMKNTDGSDPAHIAEKHGHRELKKIFEAFAVSFFFLSLYL